MRLTVAAETRLDADGGGAAGFEIVQDLDHGLGSQVFVVMISDLDHGRVDAGAKALYFGEGEEAIGGGFSGVDAKMALDGAEDRRAVSEHAGRGCAELQMISTHGLTIEHGVECASLINFSFRNI